VINQTLQDGVVFKSESDKIIYDLQKLGLQLQSQFSWSTLTSWIINPFSLPTNLCILALLIAVVYLFFRVRSLAAMIIMLQQVRPVEVQSISFQDSWTEFLKQKTEKTSTPATYFNIPLQIRASNFERLPCFRFIHSSYNNYHLPILTMAQF
jgi:hypothetical protein